MNRLLSAVSVLALSASLFACAGVTPGQQASETTNSSAATGKKAWDRVAETACTGSAADCQAQKAQNQATEQQMDANNKAKEAADRAP